MSTSITCDSDGLDLITAAGIRLKAEFDGCIYLDADVEHLEHVILSDLMKAMRKLSQRCTKPGLQPSDVYVWVSTQRPSPPDQQETMELYLKSGSTIVESSFKVFDPVTTNPEAARSLSQTFAESRNIRIAEIRYVNSPSYWPETHAYLEINLEFPSSEPVGVLHDCWNTIYLILTNDQADSADAVRALVLAGRLSMLIGQAETEWLEVKRQGYPFENPANRHELAMDIAAMANTPTGGILLIGLATKRDQIGRDIIAEVHGCDAETLPVGKYRGVLKQLVVPRIDRIDLQAVPYGKDRYILMIYVPPQPSSIQPFIVRGGYIIHDRINGEAFTIPYRTNDARWHMTAEQVQTWLAVGNRLRQEPSLARSHKFGKSEPWASDSGLQPFRVRLQKRAIPAMASVEPSRRRRQSRSTFQTFSLAKMCSMHARR
jgi:hypothetical protein